MRRDPADHSKTKRLPWETPRLESLGRIVELVQGQGKIETQDDQDPQNTSKPGVG